MPPGPLRHKSLPQDGCCWAPARAAGPDNRRQILGVLKTPTTQLATSAPGARFRIGALGSEVAPGLWHEPLAGATGNSVPAEEVAHALLIELSDASLSSTRVCWRLGQQGLPWFAGHAFNAVGMPTERATPWMTLCCSQRRTFALPQAGVLPKAACKAEALYRTKERTGVQPSEALQTAAF